MGQSKVEGRLGHELIPIIHHKRIAHFRHPENVHPSRNEVGLHPCRLQPLGRKIGKVAGRRLTGRRLRPPGRDLERAFVPLHRRHIKRSGGVVPCLALLGESVPAVTDLVHVQGRASGRTLLRRLEVLKDFRAQAVVSQPGHQLCPDQREQLGISGHYADLVTVYVKVLTSTGAPATMVVEASSRFAPLPTSPTSPSNATVVPSSSRIRHQVAVPPAAAESSRVIALAVITPSAALPKAVAPKRNSASKVCEVTAVSAVAGCVPL